MTRRSLPRWMVRVQACLMGQAWRECAHCHRMYGQQEPFDARHWSTITATGEDTPVILCPQCIDGGIGCVAHSLAGHGLTCGHPPKYPRLTPNLSLVVQWPQEPAHEDLTTILPAVSDLIGLFPSDADLELVAELAHALNPTQLAPSDDERAEAPTHAERRRLRLLTAHDDLLATVADDERTDLLQHGPRDSATGLVCHGCGEHVTAVNGVFVDYYEEFPCAVWESIAATRREAA